MAASRTLRIASFRTGTAIELPICPPLAVAGVKAFFQGKSPFSNPCNLAISAGVSLRCAWANAMHRQRDSQQRPFYASNFQHAFYFSPKIEARTFVSQRALWAQRLLVKVPTKSVVTTEKFLPAPRSMTESLSSGFTPALLKVLYPIFRLRWAV